MRGIDLKHLGTDRVICCYQIDDVLVDPGPTVCLERLEAELDGFRPRALLLTHIHLDHAGSTGVLVRKFPDLEVYVHERGARHMVDPARLLASATRLYGADMDRLWGEFAPVPERNVRVLTGGEQVLGFDVAYTPGHASHHVTYRHRASGRAFTGDVAGVSIQPSSFVLPPTPPPDIDIPLWRKSLDLLEAMQPNSLCLTHFGEVTDVGGHLNRLREQLDRFDEFALADDAAGFSTYIADIFSSQPESASSASQAAPPDQLWPGLKRYADKLREQ